VQPRVMTSSAPFGCQNGSRKILTVWSRPKPRMLLPMTRVFKFPWIFNKDT
jgi:hypothetical protein